MAENLKFRVEADDEEHRHVGWNALPSEILQGQTGLKLYHSRGDDSAPIHDIHFLARAWQLANTKAKELGWLT